MKHVKRMILVGLLVGMPVMAQEVMDVPFKADCTHPVYGDLSDEVDWSSSIMGYLFKGSEGPGKPVPCDNTDPSGLQCGSFPLRGGTHVITAICTAPNGLDDTAQVTITVDPTTSPVDSIQAPPDGAVFDKEP